jgi:hypothetical protein
MILNTPEKIVLEDDARKFIVSTIDQDFLKEHTSISFQLIVDWIETDEDSEKKLVHKDFENGEIQTFLVSKVTHNGKRNTEKKKIGQEEYESLLSTTMLHIEKRRFEFNIVQGDITFSLKYDEFKNGGLCILEVDAGGEGERNLFDVTKFPYQLQEVTEDIRYSGYRIAQII